MESAAAIADRTRRASTCAARRIGANASSPKSSGSSAIIRSAIHATVVPLSIRERTSGDALAIPSAVFAASVEVK